MLFPPFWAHSRGDEEITDQTVAMLLPYILKGLASSAIPDHRAATYLSMKAPGNSGASLSGGLLCLLVLMTLQDIQEMPKAQCISSPDEHKKSLVAALEELSSRHSVSAILKPLLARLIKSVVESPQSENEDGSKTAAAVLKALIQLALSLDKYSDFVVR
ncbi:hypothetical protein HPB52_024866 [Rhipicephalus sanguineus]|uniref:HEAT repeat-containing protein 1 n=1 Tax=Rhipicephalus sanguineus TaxID=34632 RepID=A0A9D4PB93_RHISA|nr:hypothetical protein HPB52_024866 [Rhipicephalus sanguineus]